jgi:hypothetical protein
MRPYKPRSHVAAGVECVKEPSLLKAIFAKHKSKFATRVTLNRFIFKETNKLCIRIL